MNGNNRQGRAYLQECRHPSTILRSKDESFRKNQLLAHKFIVEPWRILLDDLRATLVCNGAWSCCNTSAVPTSWPCWWRGCRCNGVRDWSYRIRSGVRLGEDGIEDPAQALTRGLLETKYANGTGITWTPFAICISGSGLGWSKPFCLTTISKTRDDTTSGSDLPDIPRCK